MANRRTKKVADNGSELIIDFTKKVITDGNELLRKLHRSSLEYVTESAFTIIGNVEKGCIPVYVNTDTETRKRSREVETAEKDAIDNFRAKIIKAKDEYAKGINVPELETLTKDIISYCLKKGYQGSAMMYLQVLGEMENSQENTEFIHNAVKEVVSGYAERLMLTGVTYKDRALSAIYQAQIGEYGEGVKDIPIQEYINAYNKTEIEAFGYSLTILKLNKKTNKHTMMTQENYDKFFTKKETRRKQLESMHLL